MIRTGIKLLAAALLGAAALSAQADTYPSRPIKVVSPFPAGGATDVLTRVLAERMAKDLGQPMIVENKAGAGTSIGAAFVSREAPDGYTILMATNSTLVTNRYLYKELPYDPDGFAPIGMVGVGPLVLLSSPKRPFASTRDLVDYAKQNPGKLTFATFGPGTSSHLAGELFKQRAGIDILHVPFKGATQALPALISGDVDLFFDMVATGMPQAAAGKVKVRHHQPRTAGDRTGAAHAGRTGLPGLRHDGLVQLRGAARHARAGAGTAAQGAGGRAGGRCREAAPARHGHRSALGHARRAAGPDPQRAAHRLAAHQAGRRRPAIGTP